MSDAERGPLWPLLPPNARMLVFACSGDGGLARAYRATYPASTLHAVEAERAQAVRAPAWCARVHQAPLEAVGAPFFQHLRLADAWVFDDFAALAEPGLVLGQIRKVLQPDASVIVRVPNAQHWQFQAQLHLGMIPELGARRYGRASIARLFQDSGLRLVSFVAVDGPPPANPALAGALGQVAQALGLDPEAAARDAVPTHLLVKAMLP